jgi:hypothetical protein
MTIKYVCPHCRTELGSVERSIWSEFKLGFPMLSAAERAAMISYDRNGDMLVSVSCEYCEQAMRAHPEFTLMMNPLQ